ncbi:MAG: ANTAR domain-containing protein [Clostridia bacterium]|nr:ANTAR domain-containing protein [Clostridia bacterium]
MSLKERVYSVLVVSAADSFNTALSELLPVSNYNPVHTVASISAAKREVAERAFDFVMINAPLPDEPGTRFAIDVSKKSASVALIFVKNDLYEAVYDKVAEHGVFVLAKPSSKPVVSHALEWMATTFERLRMTEKKTLSIEEKMEEIRVVNRAKWLLIDQLKMTESDAHRYIEKQAMDACISKREVAEEIIKTYA